LNVIGLDRPEKLVSDFWNTINNRNKVNINILKNDDVQIVDANGSRIITIVVPRAERTERPIYIDNHHDNCFRRNSEGDYRCSKEEFLSMLRDNTVKTQDMLTGTIFSTTVSSLILTFVGRTGFIHQPVNGAGMYVTFTSK
jgi:hypothetical protein